MNFFQSISAVVDSGSGTRISRSRAAAGALFAACSLLAAPSHAQVISQDGYSYSGLVDATPLGASIRMDQNSAWPSGTNLGSFAFRGGVFDGEYIWLVPVDSDEIVRVDPADGSMTGFPLPPVGTNTQLFVGGVFDGTYIWLVPHDATAVVRVTVSNGSTDSFNAWPGSFVKGPGDFAGGIFDGTYVWLVPFNADRLIRLDPEDGSMVGFDFWPAGYIKDPEAFWGGVSDGENLWLVPYSADRVIRVNTSNGTMTAFNGWPSGFVKGNRAFAAGTFDGESIWLAPYDADRIVAVDASTGAMTGYDSWPSDFSKSGEAFAGAIYDGADVWFVPFDADRVVKIDPSNGTMTGYDEWPDEVTATDGNKFAGAVFDGTTIFLVAAETHVLVSLSNPDDSQLSNLSARAQVGTGDNILIPGFVISGTGSKTVLVRGIGPELETHGVNGFLETPTIRLVSELSGDVATNTGWSTAPNAGLIAQTAVVLGAFELPNGSADSALLETLAPGSYTVHLAGVGNTTGVGLVEIYDADPLNATARLVNVSARAQVGTGGNILIPGYVVAGSGSRRLLIRAVGPTLTVYHVAGVLEDPTLTVYSGTSAIVATNDDWGAAPNAAEIESVSNAIGAFPLTAGSKDAAALITVGPGSYTVQVSGVGATTGVALVEIFEVD